MSNSNYGETLTTLLWIAYVAFYIAAGIISWNWIEPDGFGSFIGFLILWGILCAIGRFLAMGIFALIARNK